MCGSIRYASKIKVRGKSLIFTERMVKIGTGPGLLPDQLKTVLTTDELKQLKSDMQKFPEPSAAELAAPMGKFKHHWLKERIQQLLKEL